MTLSTTDLTKLSMKQTSITVVLLVVAVSTFLLIPSLTLNAILNSVSFSVSEESVQDLPTPPSRYPPAQEVDGDWIMLSQPKFVEAGFHPKFIGDHLASSDDWYPIVSTLAEEDQAIAKTLNKSTGYADLINDFLPGYVNFLKGKPIAFVVDDLRKAGYDPDDARDLRRGLLAIFHLKIDVADHDVTFPKEARLHFKYIDYDHDVVINAAADMVAKQPGDYYFANFLEVRQLFDNIYREIPRQHVVWGLGRELKIVKITGFDEDSVKVEDLPRIEGVLMTHEVFLGSWNAVSGWQWFGRPEGLFQSQQVGFVQP